MERLSWVESGRGGPEGEGLLLGVEGFNQTLELGAVSPEQN